MNNVEKIKERVSIVDVIGAFVHLEKAGNNYKAKCPFHNEKTPSFFISPDRGTYYCFGCGVKGDIFTFIQEFEGLDFKGALKVLAEKAGIPLETYSPKEKNGVEDDTSALYDAMEEAATFYEKELGRQPEALAYLKDRGLTDGTIKKWRLGFALDNWRVFYNHALKKRISEETLLRAGLIKKPDSEGGQQSGTVKNPYDRFRSRIMFPIFDSAGRVIAFSGRIFGKEDDSAKYLNSPETPLFSKSKVLYGYDRAKHPMRKMNFALLVEGQMDLLMCHQAGFENTVAVSGTALTAEHIALVKRFTDNLLLALDADSAGFKATVKASILGLSLGMNIKIASLPAGLDPADAIKTEPEVWKKAVKEGKHIIEFLLAHAKNLGYDRHKLWMHVEKEIVPYIAALPGTVEQSHFIQTVARETGITESVVWEAIARAPRIALTEGETPSSQNNEAVKENRISKIFDGGERRLLSLVVWEEGRESPKISAALIEQLNTLSSGKFGEKVKAVSLEERGELTYEAEARYSENPPDEKDIEELVLNFEEELLKQRLTEAMAKLREAEVAKDEARAYELLKECQILSLEIGRVKNRRYK